MWFWLLTYETSLSAVYFKTQKLNEMNVEKNAYLSLIALRYYYEFGCNTALH